MFAVLINAWTEVFKLHH